jgi:predicted HAD superfamily Cof-like phosphohydrolase
MRNYDRVSNWLKVAGKEPSVQTMSVQTGVMIEEFVEFLETVSFGHGPIEQTELYNAIDSLKVVAHSLKKDGKLLDIKNRVNCLDALCDIDVTLNGVAFLAGFDKNGADDEVLNSNDSKFEPDGPVILPGGKIGKGRNYVAPNLEPYV